MVAANFAAAEDDCWAKEAAEADVSASCCIQEIDNIKLKKCSASKSVRYCSKSMSTRTMSENTKEHAKSERLKYV